MSQDFKSALDQEVRAAVAQARVLLPTNAFATQIGLDDTKSSSTVTAARPDLDSKLTEEMRRASEAAAWGGAAPASLDGSALPAQATPEAAAPDASAQPPVQLGKLPDLSKLDD